MFLYQFPNDFTYLRTNIDTVFIYLKAMYGFSKRISKVLSVLYFRYETSKGDKSLYSLTWTTEFPHKNDTVYFAHCYPYTYTDLQDYLLELSNDPIKSKICKQRVLCRTLAGNLVYLLTITSPSTNPEDIKVSKHKHPTCHTVLTSAVGL